MPAQRPVDAAARVIARRRALASKTLASCTCCTQARLSLRSGKPGAVLPAAGEVGRQGDAGYGGLVAHTPAREAPRALAAALRLVLRLVLTPSVRVLLQIEGCRRRLICACGK